MKKYAKYILKEDSDDTTWTEFYARYEEDKRPAVYFDEEIVFVEEIAEAEIQTKYKFWDDLFAEDLYFDNPPNYDTINVYKHPHDTEPEEYKSILQPIEYYITGYEDFNFFLCEFCNRYVCEQNPSNGYMLQYRTLWDEDYGEKICNKCLEEMLEEGSDSLNQYMEEQPLAIALFGAPQTDGWEEGETFYIQDEKKLKEIREYLKKHSDSFYYIELNRVAYFGGEGSITVWFKKKEKNKCLT